MIYDVTDNFFPLSISQTLYDVCCNLSFENGTTSESDLTENQIPTYTLIGMIGKDRYVTTPYDGYLMLASHFVQSFVINNYSIDIDPFITRFHIIEHTNSSKCFGIPHTDIRDEDGEFISCLFYPGWSWNSDWGGATIISGHKVNFVPNRIVCFNSRTLHFGERVFDNESRRFVFNMVFKVLGDNPFSVVSDGV